jgi:hypothetical protein
MPRPSKRSKVSSPTTLTLGLDTGGQVITGVQPSLASLPIELLFEILSYFPSIPWSEILTAHLRKYPAPVVPAVYRQLFDVLRTLSQTCKGLRSILLPLAFKRIEACTIQDDSETAGKFFRQLGKRLERKSKGLVQCEHLLPCVQYVNKQTNSCSI